MTFAMRPLKLWTAESSPNPFPNPFKVTLILKELDLPYETEILSHSEIKGPDYAKINPNGRLPTLYDPNTDLTIWESGAIITYIIEKYDQDTGKYRLSFPRGTNAHHLTNQWLHFQMSGQGPYYGQWHHFDSAHPERIQSAVDRYADEIKRVTTVLDTWLSCEHGRGVKRQYLVSDKCTYADLAFIPWQSGARLMRDMGKIEFDSESKHVWEWLERLMDRPAIKAYVEEKNEAMKEFAS